MEAHASSRSTPTFPWHVHGQYFSEEDDCLESYLSPDIHVEESFFSVMAEVRVDVGEEVVHEVPINHAYMVETFHHEIVGERNSMASVSGART